MPELALDAAPSPDAPDLRAHRRFRSSFLARERDVLVYLPPGYDEAAWAKRVDPVLRFLFPKLN